MKILSPRQQYVAQIQTSPGLILYDLLRRQIRYIKAHTDRTRFGNATRIVDFQCRSALIFFHCSQTFGNVLAI